MPDLGNLTIEFLDEKPQGLRAVTQSNWSIESLLCSRSRLNETLGEKTIWNHLDVPGVYILVGPPDREGQPDRTYQARLYIGQGDSIAERLDSHLKSESKQWWQTAVIFKRTTPLNLSNCKYLESRLYRLAQEAGKCLLENKVAPQRPAMSSGETKSTENFLQKIQVFMAAFGWNLFEPEVVVPPPGPEDPPPVPPNLKPVFEELKMILSSLPKAQFYWTRVPDYRAKVTEGEDAIVFAGLRWTKGWFWLGLKGGARYKVAKPADIDEKVRGAIQKAYRAGDDYLRRARSK